MAKLGLAINLFRCIGCNTCVNACKMQNSVPMGMHWNRVLTEGCEVFDGAEGTYPNLTRTYIPLACQHCENPACLRVCPTGATYKDDKGRVEIDYDKCIGCRMCVMSCPYGHPKYFPEKGVSGKCDGCYGIRANGSQPACVAGCPNRALDFGDVDELRAKYGDDLNAGTIVVLPSPDETHPNVLIKAKDCSFDESAVELTW